MALYENVAKVRKLIGVRRVKRWITPGERVDLDSSDVRHLSGNAAFMQLAKKEKPKEKKPAVKKTTSDEVDKQQMMIDKKTLMESLTGMTKERIIEVAESIVGIDVLSRTKKAKLIKQVLAASKNKGYRYVLEHS